MIGGAGGYFHASAEARHVVSAARGHAEPAEKAGMNIRLRGLMVGLVVVMGVGTLGTAAATGTTPRPRTVMLEKLNHVRAAYGLGTVSPALRLRLAALRHSDNMVSRACGRFLGHTGACVWT